MLLKNIFLTTFSAIIKLYNQIWQNYHFLKLINKSKIIIFDFFKTLRDNFGKLNFMVLGTTWRSYGQKVSLIARGWRLSPNLAKMRWTICVLGWGINLDVSVWTIPEFIAFFNYLIYGIKQLRNAMNSEIIQADTSRLLDLRNNRCFS